MEKSKNTLVIWATADAPKNGKVIDSVTLINMIESHRKVHLELGTKASTEVKEGTQKWFQYVLKMLEKPRLKKRTRSEGSIHTEAGKKTWVSFTPNGMFFLGLT